MNTTDTPRHNVPVTYGDGIYVAHTVAPHRWNGWILPSFTREVADQLAADLAEQEARDPDEYRTLVRWNDELQGYILQSADLESQGYQPEVVTGHDVDDVTIYAIGAGVWTWYEAEEGNK